MGHVPYVGFATYRRATVRIHLYFKRLMFMKCFVKKKKKKREGRHSVQLKCDRPDARATPSGRGSIQERISVKFGKPIAQLSVRTPYVYCPAAPGYFKPNAHLNL
jgi:hypothetical protein